MIAAAFAISLFLIVVLTVAIRFVMVAAGRRVGERVASTHRALEEIVQHGRVPAAWTEELRRRMPGAVGGTPRQQQEAKRFLLRRLKGLQRYGTRMSLVDGPETRAIILDRLARAEREWTAADLQRIV